ncbi:Hypothetical protein CINCED_3A004431 [Cinara cedri]|uniref:Uncharacterized protein n=1 Tax=Cinara cedri TaxID=506608 RepID=A0A5E4MVI8_9HEMI|nr:Hypothetical protein CINCED_3A004431 [Cinara cedri]
MNYVLTSNEEAKLPILRSEFELVLHYLKQNKAAGADNITAELLQFSSMMIKNALYRLRIYMRKGRYRMITVKA